MDDDLASTHFIYYKLKERAETAVVDMVESGIELLKKMKHTVYHVVFLDYLMSGMDGIDVLRVIRDKYPQTKVIFHTAIHDLELLKVILNAGAHGLMYKHFKCAEAWRSVETVMDDRHFMSEEYFRMIHEDSSFFKRQTADEETKKPSDREMEILLWTVAGLSAKEIGGKLNITADTVSTHLKHVNEKIQENTIYGYIRYCLLRNIFSVTFLTSDDEKEKVITRFHESAIPKKGDKKIPKNR